LIPPDVHEEIIRRLHRAEAEHSVRILFAIESGSRAWGFASPNSDYDVRFIYTHEPRWYQSVDLESRRDVIEYPIVDEIDLNGWDVRKALRLFWKSNPAFVEWLQSPITYIERGDFRHEALALLPSVYTPTRGVYHYLHMARTNYRGYLREPMVRLKKYFYVLRPLLAVRWLHRYASAAPIEFEKLLVLLDDAPEVLAEIHTLLERKRQTPETGLAPRVPVLNAFIEAELARAPDLAPVARSASVANLLNPLFHRVLDAWPQG